MVLHIILRKLTAVFLAQQGKIIGGKVLLMLDIYHEGSKAQLTENINAALPYMDADMRELAKRALSKVDALTEEEFAELTIYAAEEV